MKCFNAIVLVLIISIFIPSTRSAALLDQGMILTVGPGGNHPTIQAAVNAALNSLDSSPIEIRVAAGTYVENIGILSAMDHGSVKLSGGWNANFSSRDLNPAVTMIDGGAVNRVFDITPLGGELTIQGFTIANGRAQEGAGLRCILFNSARVTLNDNHIRNNTATAGQDDQTFGGGIYARLNHSNRLVITGNLIRENQCLSPPGRFTNGAGMYVEAWSNAVFNIGSNVIENNSATGDSKNFGTGAYILAFGSNSGDVSDNIIRRNAANLPSTGAGQSPGQLGVGGYIQAFGTSTVTARRNFWLDNVNNTPVFSADVQVSAIDSSSVLFTDSVVAGARGDVGLRVGAEGMSTVYLTNLTITDNQKTGLFIFEGGAKALFNSIIFNNGTNAGLGGAHTGNNLIDINPKFVNSAARDYHMLAGSPAINAGMNDPPGTLGPMDLDQHTRITGGTVDIGAYEMGEPDFALGFDQGTFFGDRGAKTKVQVNIIRMGGFPGNVTVSLPEVLPDGVRPKALDTIATTGSFVTFKLKIKGNAATGPHLITFRGRDDSGKERNATVTLVIQ